jgi:hypothetical protein
MEPCPNLSICISTYNRGKFIGQTLDTIISQLEPDVEIIVVDGDSQDRTPEVMAQYLVKYSAIRYFREHQNSGVDRDYDKAVRYATGRYCWLMTDDDLLLPGAVRRVLAALKGDSELVVVNSEHRSYDLSVLLEERRLNVACDLRYGQSERESFFRNTAYYLSFIGSVVINRNFWLSRNRAAYYGTFFVHVGVIFQHPPIEKVDIIADPLIVTRHGNCMWDPRAFEVWAIRWQELIWSFPDYSDQVKRAICQRDPWRRAQFLLFMRATGAYSVTEFDKYLSGRAKGFVRAVAYAVAIFPAALANFILVLYFSSVKRMENLALRDLLRSSSATTASQLLARALRKQGHA